MKECEATRKNLIAFLDPEMMSVTPIGNARDLVVNHVRDALFPFVDRKKKYVMFEYNTGGIGCVSPSSSPRTLLTTWTPSRSKVAETSPD